jgi:hypothetical protein
VHFAESRCAAALGIGIGGVKQPLAVVGARLDAPSGLSGTQTHAAPGGLTRQDKSAPKFPDLVHDDFTTRVDVYAPATYAAKRTDHGRSKSNGQSFLQNQGDPYRSLFCTTGKLLYNGKARIPGLVSLMVAVVGGSGAGAGRRGGWQVWWGSMSKQRWFAGRGPETSERSSS